MNKKFSTAAVVAGIIIFILVIFGSRMFKIIQPGEMGIVFRPYTSGLDKDHVKESGFHIIAPWNDLIVYEVREQKIEESLDVLDKKGLSIRIDVTLRFHPIFSKIGYIHENFSKDYADRLIIPELRSSARKVFGRYEAEEIYSTKRAEVETAIITETSEILGANNVMLKTLLIRSIILPEKIRSAIDSKEEQRQIAEAMQYKLEKEEQEAQRKRIEAQGISDYNKIISASLTDRILQQKGIDATLKLSESTNSKVVVVGGGKDGLPLILGNN